jgi:hypothetical protein
MTREELDIGHDDGLPALPGSAANASSEGDVHAGNGTLEGAEHQLIVIRARLGHHPIKACPPEAHGLMNGSRHVRHHGHCVTLALNERLDLLYKQLIVFCFRHIVVQRYEQFL